MIKIILLSLDLHGNFLVQSFYAIDFDFSRHDTEKFHRYFTTRLWEVIK